MNTFLSNFSKTILLFVFICLVASGCKDDENVTPDNNNLVNNNDAEVPMAWMNLFLEMDRYTQDFRPVPVARALAYINLAAYESVMKGMPDFKSLKDVMVGLDMPAAENKEYHYPTVVNTVYANLFKRFIPSGYILNDHQSELQFEILALQESFNESFRNQVGAEIFNRSVAHGETVANAVWNWSRTDVFGHDGHVNARPNGYTPPSGPGLWQPTPPDFSAALFPYWGKVRTFAISETEKLARPPLVFSQDPSSQLYVQALEVRNAVNNLQSNDQWIADFWSDDYVGLTFSPSSRWISITSQILKGNNYDLETALYAYAKVSFALNDAGVAAWHSKYHYNVERPVSYIRRVFEPDWATYLSTNPSFPAYPSGHATFGAAAAEVLSHIFGYDYHMTDTSHEGRTEFLGMPRTFDTFYQMAEENAYSRLPAGVHFRMDYEEGLRLGYQVGRKINSMPFK